MGTRLAPHSVLETTLKVDTTSRAMGDFVIPIDVFTADDVGVRQHLQASQSIRVNPGWATSKTRLALRVKSEDEEVVSDEFVLLQTSDEHPFEVTNTSITHLEMKVDVQEVDATEITEQVVVGTTPDVKWAATPRFRVRLSAPASTINARETAQLTMLLSHGLTRVLMDVQLLPVERALRVTPAELRLDGAAAVSMREFVISARNSLDSVRIALPAGISVASRTPLGKTLLKVTVQIDHATWKGENILIADTNGNEAILSIQPTS
ncbi:MAG: hypothetical protein HYV60_15560 [Planctomycetia bacterium]|nr:hypothetical protein [Planctomycetia bacterium]